MVQSGKAKKFSFHYTDDPRKTEAWVEKQREKKSGEEFERELNMSYEGSLENTVYAAQFNLCNFGSFPYDPAKRLFVGWDFGLDATSMGWYQWDYEKDRWYLVDSFEKSNMDVGFFAPFITGIIEDGYTYTQQEIDKIKEHKNWNKATHFGDPDVKKRAYQVQGSISTRQVLQKYGIYVQSKDWNGRTHYDLKQNTLLFLKKLSINTDNNTNELFCDAIRNAKYPERTEGSQSTSPIDKPIHDWTSHSRTMLEYMADNVPKRTEFDYDKNEKIDFPAYKPNY